MKNFSITEVFLFCVPTKQPTLLYFCTPVDICYKLINRFSYVKSRKFSLFLELSLIF